MTSLTSVHLADRHEHDQHEHEARDDRVGLLARATFLNRVSLAYNFAEAAIALGAGIAAGSISLLGFGLDSVVEVSAALVMTWWWADAAAGLGIAAIAAVEAVRAWRAPVRQDVCCG
jgi:divalent metal cation (Fe/Co/Zn/Cd) transporter